MQNITIFITLTIALSLSGCSTTARTLTASSTSISYEYNHVMDDAQDIAKRAETHCAKYGKEANFSEREYSKPTMSSNLGTIDIFECK